MLISAVFVSLELTLYRSLSPAYPMNASFTAGMLMIEEPKLNYFDEKDGFTGRHLGNGREDEIGFTILIGRDGGGGETTPAFGEEIVKRVFGPRTDEQPVAGLKTEDFDNVTEYKFPLKWTPSHDAALLQGVADFGNDFRKILDESPGLEGRGLNGLKPRLKYLLQHGQRLPKRRRHDAP